MSNVFANGKEVSAKKDGNKSICAMPDVCLSPPSPPAGPVPIPYPNTSDASKTDGGSKSVKIGGKEVGLKNNSTYKKSNGDEAATRSLGMGVVTHTIQGKTKHAAWSMDVKIEGKNAIRHMDITTHNHINNPNIAIVLDQAAQNIELVAEPECSGLDTENLNVQKNDLRKSAQNSGGYTTTVGSYTPTGGGNSYLMLAATPQDIIKSSSTSAFAEPRPSFETMACSDVQYGSSGYNNHTEPKLIEQIFDAARENNISMPTKNPGALGKLKMSISREVCARCQKGICEAVKCGLDITLCEGHPAEENDARTKCESGEFQSL
jgi:hypothetical protein